MKYWKIITREFLTDQYITKKKTAYDISKLIGYKYGTVYIYLKKYGISSRTRAEALRLSKIGKLRPVEHCKNMSIAQSLHILKNKSQKIGFFNTKPEIKMTNILKFLGFDFKHPYPVTNILHGYSADFFISSLNLIIEVDGLYWHNYPYGTDLDSIRNIELKEAGYTILRFWENEVDENVVREKIEQICWEPVLLN